MFIWGVFLILFLLYFEGRKIFLIVRYRNESLKFFKKKVFFNFIIRSGVEYV